MVVQRADRNGRLAGLKEALSGTHSVDVLFDDAVESLKLCPHEEVVCSVVIVWIL